MFLMLSSIRDDVEPDYKYAIVIGFIMLCNNGLNIVDFRYFVF